VFYGKRPGTQNAVERLPGAGFDAVIGNPPYDELSEHALGRPLHEARFFDEKPAYTSVSAGRRNWYPNATIAGKKVHFPKRELKTVEYNLEATYHGIYEFIVSGITILAYFQSGNKLGRENPQGREVFARHFLEHRRRAGDDLSGRHE